jgi:hypothetical protein
LDGLGTIVNLISSTTTKKGLKIEAENDSAQYEKGIKVSDAETVRLNIEPASFHDEWNYKILPQETSSIAY